MRTIDTLSLLVVVPLLTYLAVRVHRNFGKFRQIAEAQRLMAETLVLMDERQAARGEQMSRVEQRQIARIRLERETCAAISDLTHQIALLTFDLRSLPSTD